MKLIKKIAAIMFAFMMVFSLSTNVKAVEGTTGSITIKNPKKGETYTVYKVLKLESHNPESKHYSYLPATDAWKKYFKDSDNQYMRLNENGYVETKHDETDAQQLAQALIKQAKKIAESDTDIAKKLTANDDTVNDNGDLVFSDLGLGYYVIDSTVSTICALDTTNPDATIQPKHVEPTVDKQIWDENKNRYVTMNSVNIGVPIMYQTEINVKKGATNYVLHDQMHSGLTYVSIFDVYDNIGDTNINLKPNDWTVSTATTDSCAFELKFNQEYFNRINQDTVITVKYIVKANENAPINTAMENKTWLTYGNTQKTEEKITQTYTFGIPVYKYTGDNTPLPGAKFILSTDENFQDDAKTLKFTTNSENKYRYDSTGGKTELVSLNDGHINIQGIKAGTYYLKEIEAPKGYNLLKTIQKITISENGSIELNDIQNDGDVKVQNKKGSLLPSTGGMGTTLIYLVGGALVLGSGFVLANKKRAKAK
ncbi:SpaH/EbpB family LPXTG-anchored major pilin [Holdemanella porci]|uniref:SpaH/EbpB family LPXTG-anchored major pilin n=1 Tax=Holdemanella porci TaxID=2652276 RepID=UPI003F93A334